jgi:hypothetical protein
MVDPTLLGVAGTIVATAARVAIYMAGRQRRSAATRPGSSHTVIVTVQREVRVPSPEDSQNRIAPESANRTTQLRRRSAPTTGTRWASGRPTE